MASKNFFVFLVTALVLAALAVQIVSASTFGTIMSVEVDGVTVGTTTHLATFAGQSVPVQVVFNATADAQDVRVKAWISGDQGLAVSSDRFDVIAGNMYSKRFLVRMPTNIDPSEQLTLTIRLESENAGTADQIEIPLTVERESYLVEILDVTMDSKIGAGDTLPIDVVLKNRGRHFADDTFVKVQIPELGLETKAYFSDLSPVDQGGNVVDKQDAAERRLLLRIPSDAPAGLYTVEFEAFNADSSTNFEKKLLVTGAEAETMVVAPSTSKTFTTDKSGSYSITLVNKGNTVRVYELSVDAPSDLSVDISEPVVVIPAGSSRSIKIDASSTKAGKYTFTVNANSDSKTLQSTSYTANVVESSGKTTVITSNTTVLLTVILAIVFIVLLVVLIVLLTRKPQKSEEFGESYY
ncbi:MAG: hypothetical protein Q7S74_02720 [Nanoarchaeota archaeon]|nr:hypothetical protein [Nanoarchaeota archaeon]